MSTVKHLCGSILVWECFSVTGIGDLIRIDAIMKKMDYGKILETNAIPSWLRLDGPGSIFMQDLDPKYSSKLCGSYIMEKENFWNLRNMD